MASQTLKTECNDNDGCADLWRGDELKDIVPKEGRWNRRTRYRGTSILDEAQQSRCRTHVFSLQVQQNNTAEHSTTQMLILRCYEVTGIPINSGAARLMMRKDEAKKPRVGGEKAGLGALAFAGLRWPSQRTSRGRRGRAAPGEMSSSKKARRSRWKTRGLGKVVRSSVTSLAP